MLRVVARSLGARSLGARSLGARTLGSGTAPLPTRFPSGCITRRAASRLWGERGEVVAWETGIHREGDASYTERAGESAGERAGERGWRERVEREGGQRGWGERVGREGGEREWGERVEMAIKDGDGRRVGGVAGAESLLSTETRCEGSARANHASHSLSAATLLQKQLSLFSLGAHMMGCASVRSRGLRCSLARRRRVGVVSERACRRTPSRLRPSALRDGSPWASQVARETLGLMPRPIRQSRKN